MSSYKGKRIEIEHNGYTYAFEKPSALVQLPLVPVLARAGRDMRALSETDPADLQRDGELMLQALSDSLQTRSPEPPPNGDVRQWLDHELGAGGLVNLFVGWFEACEIKAEEKKSSPS